MKGKLVRIYEYVEMKLRGVILYFLCNYIINGVRFNKPSGHIPQVYIINYNDKIWHVEYITFLLLIIYMQKSFRLYNKKFKT